MFSCQPRYRSPSTFMCSYWGSVVSKSHFVDHQCHMSVQSLDTPRPHPLFSAHIPFPAWPSHFNEAQLAIKRKWNQRRGFHTSKLLMICYKAQPRGGSKRTVKLNPNTASVRLPLTHLVFESLDQKKNSLFFNSAVSHRAQNQCDPTSVDLWML